jgi:hypothetical protein
MIIALLRYFRFSTCYRPKWADHISDLQRWKRDTEARPLLTDEDEEKRREEEAREKPLDPE